MKQNFVCFHAKFKTFVKFHKVLLKVLFSACYEVQ